MQMIFFKGTIKRKITIIICSSILIIIFMGIALGYLFGYSVLHNFIGRQYIQIAKLLGDGVNDSLAAEIENAKVYTTLPLWVDIIKDANLKYNKMNSKEMDVYFKEMDNKWSSAQKGDPLFWEYLNNRVSVTMRDIVKVKGNPSEIFITDKYGGVVAASGRTRDFYHADESWWQEAYNKGEGKVYVGDIEFDESSASWCIPIAAPIRDEKNEIIGICKDSINIYRLFHVLDLFKIGTSGQAILVDMNGNIIYHTGSPTMKMKFCSAEEVKRLLSRKEQFFTANKQVLHNRNLFFADSLVKPPYLSDRGIYWVMFIAQDQAETFDPLYKFVMELTLVALILIIISIPVGAFFGEMIARPIHDLHLATEKVLSGDWDYKIDVHTGDEIEQFADAFKTMISNIKDKQTKLKDFSHGLEEKVGERTKELAETQEATLNILEDLEEAKETLERSNKALKQLDQLKSDFISTVSHELRTPLSIIKESVSLILDKIPGDINEKQQKILDISKVSIDRLARIIDSLLDISKIEAGKIELKRSLIDIAEIVKHVTDSFEIKVKEKGLALKLDIDKTIGKVYADPDRITQVLINLMGNAIKFTSSGYIEVSCKDAKDTVMCSVKDTGVGISKDDLPNLFNKFQQFGRLAGAGEKGAGLGLSIAKGIIDMHNGSISVESEPGIGSRFTFALHKYTDKSLFSEFTERAIKRAGQSRSKLSIIIISSKMKDDLDNAAWLKNFNAAINNCSRRIKDTLRKQGDEVVSNNGDMLVILADCNKDHSILVWQRLEQILDKSLEEKKIRDKLDMRYGCATFPDDGKTETELINKARTSVCDGRLNMA
jgi:signal transduction histidine kinase